jgi:hypothetical protein
VALGVEDAASMIVEREAVRAGRLRFRCFRLVFDDPAVEADSQRSSSNHGPVSAFRTAFEFVLCEPRREVHRGSFCPLAAPQVEPISLGRLVAGANGPSGPFSRPTCMGSQTLFTHP